MIKTFPPRTELGDDPSNIIIRHLITAGPGSSCISNFCSVINFDLSLKIAYIMFFGIAKSDLSHATQ